ncbi:MAG: hypothetical protein DRJ03_23640 [Chloroflexi bacterium]|nr:MAG: hypothetical protein DRJ03_23640 [Chloroflexota bacterium]
MEKLERKSGDKVVAYKIAQHCSRKDCGRIASYYLEQDYLCTVHFKKAEKRFASKGIKVIFPTYQEPQFGRLKSNMLVLTANSGKRVKNGGWDVKNARRQARKKSSGKSRKRKNYGILDTL